MKVPKDRYNIWADNRPHDAAWKAEMEYRNENRYHTIPDFAAYPDQLFYGKDAIASRDSQKNQRIAAETYLERVTKWNQKRLEQIRQGNRFGEYLVELYGDLPLYQLAMKWERGDKANSTQAEEITDTQGELWGK